jgi:type IV secretion system protein VirB1
MIDFLFLAQQCMPEVHADTLQRIVRVESSYNPYAIGVVGGHLERQPRDRAEALATVRWLEQNGYNYSMGLGQVNKKNLAKYGLTQETVFEACPNLRASGEILKECFLRARKSHGDDQAALRASFSCYYSGNFITGFKHGYVLKIVTAGTGGGAYVRSGGSAPPALRAAPAPARSALAVARAAPAKQRTRQSTTEPRLAAEPSLQETTAPSAFIF